ncbi:MAG: ATP-binding cassette domain-containing protein, partial [Chlorobiales bacterium]|nr:ATP-binding cassette domain-containing protein [Chlorobiales bacterium]
LAQTAGELSFGQQKLLSIGMLLMNEASLLLLDEPFAGVNAKMIDHISEVMSTLKQQGKTIMMIEHNRAKASSISDTQFFLSKGQVITKGTYA